MKTIKLEIGRILNGGGERRKVWFDLACDCRTATNAWWRTWESWHHGNGSAAIIKADLRAADEWKNRTVSAGKKNVAAERPKWRVQAIPKELANRLYRVVVDAVPNVHVKTAGTLMQKLNLLCSGRKAASGNLRGWAAILLDREGRPSSTHPHPIPIHHEYLKLVPPEEKNGEWRIRFAVERTPRDGKRSETRWDEVATWTKGRKYRNVTSILLRIATGELRHHGGSLTYDANKRKWFLNLTWSSLVEVAKARVDPNMTATLHPAIRHPWTLFLPGGGKQWMLGRGDFVARVREQLLAQRWNRQANYRNAGSSTKGHGRGRALLPIDKLSRRWKDFVKRLNHTLTTDAVRVCESLGIGEIVYVQPAGSVRDKRFLSRAGKVAGREDSTGWDWYQVASMLAYKCKERGIKLVVRKSGEDAVGENPAAKSNGKPKQKRLSVGNAGVAS